jgi:hypothetical protein
MTNQHIPSRGSPITQRWGIRITNIGQQLQAIIRRQLHYLSLFPASTSYGFLRGALLPRPQTPHLAECTCVYTVVMRFVRANATRNTSRWRRSLTTALTAALLIFRSHQLLSEETQRTWRETCQRMCTELEFYTCAMLGSQLDIMRQCLFLWSD